MPRSDAGRRCRGPTDSRPDEADGALDIIPGDGIRRVERQLAAQLACFAAAFALLLGDDPETASAAEANELQIRPVRPFAAGLEIFALELAPMAPRWSWTYASPSRNGALMRERTASGAVIEWAIDSYKVRVLRMIEIVRADGSVAQVVDGTVLGLETIGIVAIGNGVQVPGRQPEQHAKPLLQLPATV